MSSDNVCSETSWDGWNSRPCRRALKTAEQEEARLCGIHLAAKKRVERNREAREARWAQESLVRKRAHELARALNAAGVECASDAGRVVLTLESAGRLVQRLTEEPRP